MTRMLRSIRILSAAGVVGPLAASAMILALILPALSAVITFSTAAGMKMSHCSYIRFSPSYGLAPGNPTIVPFSFL
uniref:Putative secreted protein n=1 Tax=Anopheles darlingi TaxID=43151 RepID=A0A2M4D9W9_ANODA